MTNISAARLHIRWAPKLRLDNLARLYQLDAAGMPDAELLADVGWTLYCRVRDVVRVSSSLVVCPGCRTELPVRWLGEQPDIASSCPECAWSVTAEEYHLSWEHRDLNGHSEEFEYFLAQFPTARSDAERMLLIDRLVHAAHVASSPGSPSGKVARNLLEGNRRKIRQVLDQLAG
jgi:hypothetical protein